MSTCETGRESSTPGSLYLGITESQARLCFEPEKFLANLGGIPGLQTQMIETAEQQFESSIADLEKALAADDAKSIKKAAHKLKGAALTMTCWRLALIAARIEDGSLVDAEELRAAPQTLRTEAAAACEEMKKLLAT